MVVDRDCGEYEIQIEQTARLISSVNRTTGQFHIHCVDHDEPLLRYQGILVSFSVDSIAE